MSDASQAPLPIGTVERETGLSKDVLRVWERRYGFPHPLRDANGDRVYPPEQVVRLQLIKRLMDRGKRPGGIVHRTVDELRELLAAQEADNADTDHDEQLLDILRQGGPLEVNKYLHHLLAGQGLKRFVTAILPRTNLTVGDAWAAGTISVFHEHLYSEQVQNILRQALQGLPSDARPPRVLLTTLPGEQHNLGLLMVHAVLLMEGAEVRSFGTQMPLMEIASAVRTQDIEVVSLSFSSAFSPTLAANELAALRLLMPDHVAIWAGGGGLRPLRQYPEGVQVVDALPEVVTALRDWRRKHLESPE